MAKFIIDVLAKARIRKTGTLYATEKIITTTVEVEGEVIKDKEQIEIYTRLEEFYEYDILEARPLANDGFEVIDAKGNKQVYYAKMGYVISELIEIFDEDIRFIEE